MAGRIEFHASSAEAKSELPRTPTGRIRGNERGAADGSNEPLRTRPDASFPGESYVPSLQVRMYFSCSAVSVSMSTSMLRSLRRATSASIAFGTT